MQSQSQSTLPATRQIRTPHFSCFRSVGKIVKGDTVEYPRLAHFHPQHHPLSTMASITVNKKPQYTVHPAPFPIDSPGFYSFSSAAFYSTLVGVPALIAYALPWTSLWTFPVAFVLCLVPLWISYVVADSFFQNWAHIQTRRVNHAAASTHFLV